MPADTVVQEAYDNLKDDRQIASLDCAQVISASVEAKRKLATALSEVDDWSCLFSLDEHKANINSLASDFQVKFNLMLDYYQCMKMKDDKRAEKEKDNDQKERRTWRYQRDKILAKHVDGGLPRAVGKALR